MKDDETKVIIVGLHSGFKVGQLIALAEHGMHRVVSTDEAGALRITPMHSLQMTEESYLEPSSIDNDPRQTQAHRQRRLMLEKQARRQANRRR